MGGVGRGEVGKEEGEGAWVGGVRWVSRVRKGEVGSGCVK